MNITDIPFVNQIGIKEQNNKLSLEFKNDILNHVKTIHAGAQFTLAETQSGIHLQTLFPDFAGKVLPLLRDAQIKYKKPAFCKIYAFSSVDEVTIEKFSKQFNKKGRGSIEVNVQIKDINDVITAEAKFTWFIQIKE